MIGRIIWLALIAVVAAVTAAVQLDRQARVSPELAAVVPEPFRAFAQSRVASNAMLGDDPALALAEAERLVERRPLPAEHIRLLAHAQINAELIDEGVVTIQVAAKRGWRDRLAQESMLRLALAAEDMPEATRRYTALFLSNQTEDDLLTELAADVFAEARGAGRRTFTDIVVGGERWHGLFLSRGSRVLPSDAFLEIATESDKRGARFECTGLRRAATILNNRRSDHAPEFQEFVSAQC